MLGINVSACRTVNREDAVLVRLYRLLVEIDATYPGEGWDAYFTPVRDEPCHGGRVPRGAVAGGGQERVSAATQSQALAAFLFFYRQVDAAACADGGRQPQLSASAPPPFVGPQMAQSVAVMMQEQVGVASQPFGIAAQPISSSAS